MKKLLGLALVSILFSGLAFSQDVRRVDLFGGYSYVSLDTNNPNPSHPHQNMNGWESGTSVSFNKWAAVESDVSGGYYTSVNFYGSDYRFMAGPRINVGSVFFHTLVGLDLMHITEDGPPALWRESFAMAIGGGVQVKVAPRWAVRSSVDYAPTYHGGLTQNNVRVGGGVVYLLSHSN